MSVYLLRIAIIVVLAAIIYFGVRKILVDWQGRFREIDRNRHERDLKERQRPDVIDLERGDDGVFRPGDKDQRGR